MTVPVEQSDPSIPLRPLARPLRWILLGLGVSLTGLAVLGAFLPVLPTTPFLLLATAAFARSSPRLQRKLLNAPIFGAYLRQWNHDRSVPKHAKRRAYGLIVITMGLSIGLVHSNGLRIGLAVLAIGLLVLMHSLATTSNEVELYEEELSHGDRTPPEAEGTAHSNEPPNN